MRLVAKRCGGEGEVVEGYEGETTVVPTKVITEMEDGQPKVMSTDVGKVVCQIEDGQFLSLVRCLVSMERANQRE